MHLSLLRPATLVRVLADSLPRGRARASHQPPLPRGADIPSAVGEGPPGPSDGQATMSARMGPVRTWLSFRRLIDVPFETCVAALDGWQVTGQDSELRFGDSLLRGPIEHDRDSGTCRIEVRLARGPLRPLLRMRLYVDWWSSSSTAVELIPCARVRPTATYFRAGHLLLDSLIHSLSLDSPPAQARGANQLVTSPIDAHVQAEQREDGEGPAGPLTPAGLRHANGTEDQLRLSGDQGATPQNPL